MCRTIDEQWCRDKPGRPDTVGDDVERLGNGLFGLWLDDRAYAALRAAAREAETPSDVILRILGEIEARRLWTREIEEDWDDPAMDVYDEALGQAPAAKKDEQ